ncbi:hypothetical protein [Flavobacterium sp.]|jgi:hypothetical protein|uniref:hypothetical protein n=1 Tax=Flavobacterium sp. TaxID=239 RepID=UPI002A815F92|nr:hypothetical protein [Flavobacterium sp.]
MNKDYRNYQLTFCKICKLRDLNINKGIICSLTNDIANFEKECADYLTDKLELDKIKVNIKNIKDNYNTNKNVSFILGTYYFIEKEKIKKTNFFRTKVFTQNKTYNQIDSRLIILTISGTISLIFLFIYFNQKFNSDFIFLFIATLFIGGVSYIVESKKEINTIKTTEDYLQYGKSKIYWREILDYGIIRKIQKGGDLYILEIFRMNHTNVKIILNNYDNLSYEKIIEILEYNKSELIN